MIKKQERDEGSLFFASKKSQKLSLPQFQNPVWFYKLICIQITEIESRNSWQHYKRETSSTVSTLSLFIYW